MSASTPTAGLKALIDAILARMSNDERQHMPGVVFTDDAQRIDDGDYGGIRDTRPDWTREDERGWISLGRLDKP